MLVLNCESWKSLDNPEPWLLHDLFGDFIKATGFNRDMIITVMSAENRSPFPQQMWHCRECLQAHLRECGIQGRFFLQESE